MRGQQNYCECGWAETGRILDCRRFGKHCDETVVMDEGAVMRISLPFSMEDGGMQHTFFGMNKLGACLGRVTRGGLGLGFGPCPPSGRAPSSRAGPSALRFWPVCASSEFAAADGSGVDTLRDVEGSD